MKDIVESIRTVDEAREIQYRVSIALDAPVDATISIDKANQRDFERWLDNEEGGLFTHAEGGNIEY